MDSANRRLISAWLDLQCSMVQGATRGAVMVGYGSAGGSDPVAVWPQGAHLTAPMMLAARQSVIDGREVMQAMALAAGSDVTQATDVIAVPLRADDQVIGTVVLEMTARMKQRQEAARQVMAWGATWLQAVIEHLNAGPTLRLNIVIESIAEAVKHDVFGGATAAVASALSRLLDCSRVAIGFRDHGRLHVAAISNTARFEQKTNLVRSVAAAMEEALDQDRRLSLPDPRPESRELKRAHEQHLTNFGAAEIHTLPFSAGGKLAGAVTLERLGETPLNPEDIALAETVVSIIGPILETKRLGQLPLPQRLNRALRHEFRRFVEPGHLSFKAALTAASLALIVCAVVKIDYQVKADATLLGQVQRAVVAPFDGYVSEAPVRAGDVVATGTVMARLDDREFKLEQARYEGEQAQYAKSQREALAQHDRAKLAILGAQRDQAEATAAMAGARLDRAELKSPIDGIVVTGDLSQSLGAPVQRGDLLFEVAPLNKYRVVLEVDERDVAEVRPGQSGKLALASLPHLRLPFTVERVVPTSTAEEGRNYFTVEARIDELDFNLKPGMAGVGKVSIGDRPLVWIWTHRLSDRLRLLLWNWWG